MDESSWFPGKPKESLTDDLRGCEFVVRGGASVEGGWTDRERGRKEGRCRLIIMPHRHYQVSRQGLRASLQNKHLLPTALYTSYNFGTKNNV